MMGFGLQSMARYLLQKCSISFCIVFSLFRLRRICSAVNPFHVAMLMSSDFHLERVIRGLSSAYLNNGLPCILRSERFVLFNHERAATPCNCSGFLCLIICYALASVYSSQPGKQAAPAAAGELSTGERGTCRSPT
ncbi:hypothetical protein ATANTOWER_005865 [Ataeniobius toweri]|uniref:Secreted protein n=1 Tax=Ataeniobius toweri TaxID=208326 RepID=A0ABU7BAT9_9TELE|nr:hypothetical protein [Ataeniobius toweri]